MKVRNPAELQTLDDDLNLFEETEWDFMAVVDTKANNYEYFNDIRDADFDVASNRLKEILPWVAIFVSVITVMVVITLKVTNFFDDSEWRELQGLQSVANGSGSTISSYVDGAEVSSQELIEVSEALRGYVSFLQMKNDYQILDMYCVGDSAFAKKYYECISRVLTIYDAEDCYARGLREFGSLVNVVRINRVLKKDGVYYCYAVLEYPTIYDVNEFINMQNQTFTMQFQGGTHISEDLVAKYLLEIVADSYVPRSNSELCIQFKEVGGEFLLVDDQFALKIAEEDYNIAVNQLLKILGSNLTT